MKKLTRYLMPRLADRFFVVSEYMMREFAQSGVPRERLRLLYNPIDTEAFRPSPEARQRLRAELGIAESQVLIGFLGRIDRRKGVFSLCEAVTAAMHRQPALHMLWVGNGGDTAEIRNHHIPPAHQDRHHFIGWTQQVAAIYPALDLVVMPSIAPETFGRVSAEAQACCVPVVCSDIGGLRETLQPQISGLLTAPGDAAALCDRILELVGDADRRRQMGDRGRQFVTAHFSATRVCDQFEKLLRGVAC